MTVDILMATFNGALYLSEQLDSLIAQTHEDWRLFVSDDGSSDETLTILERYASCDPRIRVVATEGGWGSARDNFWSLLPYAESPYVAFCDQDDVWDVDKIERCLAAMRELETASSEDTPLLVFSDMRVVNRRLNVLHDSFERLRNAIPLDSSFSHLLAINEAAGCSMMMNKSLVAVMLEESDVDEVIMHDWWAILVAAAFGKIAYIDSPLMSYRQHGANSLGARRYSPIKSLNMAKSTYLMRLTTQQTQSFLKRYGVRLDAAKRKCAELYVACASGGLQGLLNLVRSGCWRRRWPDRFAQMVSVSCVLPLLRVRRAVKRYRSGLN